MIFTVHVGVCLTRPPCADGDEWRRTVVEAGDETEAMLVAAQIAAATCEMPVWAEVVGVEI